MAVTKTHPIKSTLKAAIDYICNPEKTDGKLLVSSYGCAAETADIKAFTSELSAIGRNINQIAKRINATGSPYQADMEEIRERLDQIWQLQRHILSSQR